MLNVMSMNDYLTFARKMINRNTSSPLRELLLSDDEAVGMVAKAVMKADSSYMPEKNTKLNTWRYTLAQKAIKNRISHFKKRRKFESLDSLFDLESPLKGPEEIICGREQVEIDRGRLRKLITMLSNTERSCIEMTYFLDYSRSEISKELNISEEGVRKSILSGLALMRELANGN